MTSLAYKISAWNRARKWRLFLSELSPSPETKILDVGYNETEYSETDNYLEKHYPHQEMITALGMDDPHQFAKRYPAVSCQSYEGKDFPFFDDSFDIVWSNAVIEHVGDYSKQLRFLGEINRVGKHAFITTPNRWFPFEIHTRLPFIHWLPKSWFDRIVTWLGLGWAAGDYMHLLGKSDLKRLLKESGIRHYRIHSNRFLFWTMDYVIIF